MPFTEMVVGISAGLFGLTAFIFFLKLVQAWLLHRTLREAISRDSTVAEGLIDRIDRRERKRSLGDDDRNGLILIAMGVALAGFSLIAGDDEWLRYGIGAALFPLLIGAALLTRFFWFRSATQNDFDARA